MQLPTQNINTSVDVGQGPSVAKSGQVWDAVAQAGNKLSNFGFDLAEKRKEAETKSYLNSEKNDFNRFVADKSIELEAKYTGDPTGYASEMNNAMNDFGEQSFSRAPRDSAKALWQQDFANLSNNVGMNADAVENKKRSTFQIGRIDDNVFKNQQHLAANPDPSRAIDFMNNDLETVNSFKGLYFDDAQAKDMAVKIGSGHAEALMKGFKSNKQYDAGLSIMDGKHPQSKILLDHMTPDQISGYKMEFQNLQKAESDFSKSMFNLKAKDISGALKDGMEVPNASIQEMVNGANSLPQEERQLFLDDLNTDLQHNKIIQQAKSLPVDQVQRLAGTSIPRDTKDIYNRTSRNQKSVEFQKALSDVIDQRVNNAPDFHVENDQQVRSLSEQAKDPMNIGALKQYTSSVVSKQAVDGVKSPKILTNDMSIKYASMLKSGNPEMVDNVYQAIKEGGKVGGGDYSQTMISDMVKKGHMDADYGLALTLDDPNDRKSSIMNLQKKKEIDEQYNNFKAANGVKENENNVLNESEVNDFKDAFLYNDPRSENTGTLNGFDSLIKLEYKNNRLRMNASDAKKEAIKKVLTNNFSVIKSKNSQVILSKQYIKQADNIESFMDNSLNPININKLNLAIPKAYQESADLIDKSSDAQLMYNRDIAASGQWISNSNQSGAILYKRVGQGKHAKVLDKSGKQIEVSYDDMKPIELKNAPLVGF